MKYSAVILSFTLSILLLASCTNPYNTVRQTEANIKQNQQNLAQNYQRLRQSSPPVITSAGYYVSHQPVSLQKAPAWMKSSISLRAQAIPFNLLVDRILRNTNVMVSYQSGVESNQLVSMNYSGSIKGALDELAAKSGYAYEVAGNSLNWQAFVTRTFNISFMPGSSNYMMGQNPNNQSSGNNTTGNNGVVTTIGGLSNDQYTNLQAQLSVWKDLRATLNDLKSPQGKVFVSESTTTVTVEDHPSNVQAIATYIAQLNQTLSKQVSIQISVYELSLNKEFNYGIDWNLMQRVLGTNISLSGNLGSNSSVIPVDEATQTPGLLSATIGNPVGSHAIIQALSMQGKLSVVTQPTVVTMNNQVAEVRITRDTSYLQSVSTTTAGVSGSTTSTLTPGIVTDGFSLYLLPKIQGNKIYLQISSTLSNLTGIDTVTNQPPNINTNANESNNNSPQYQAIQVPTLAEKHFNQRTALFSGSTLIITGFQQLHDQTNTASPFGVTAIGAKSAQDQNIQTIVCITPTIIESPN